MAKSKAGKALVIVESPAKAKTINRYLGAGYVVKASMGHVRDLPERDFGIDVTNGFKPSYEVVSGRVKVLAELARLAREAPTVYLATDRDREGEAIAWHLAEALNLPAEKIRRVIFNEITGPAIAEAFQHPHEIDLDRVNAQQARRILDRIVGYELSPLLWKKIAKGLSAGRVQSVVVRLIVEREREIRRFRPEEYWVIAPLFAAQADAAPGLARQWQEYLRAEPTAAQKQVWLEQRGAFTATLIELPEGSEFRPTGRLTENGDGTFTFSSAVDQAMKAAEALGCEVREVHRTPRREYPHLEQLDIELSSVIHFKRLPRFHVERMETKRRLVQPPAPFTTASLQQQASTQLGFKASRTMRVAQALYEGVDLKGEGLVGLITYMRTDSTNLAEEAVTAVRRYITGEFGREYCPESPRVYGKRQERAQEAHEAIRPTDVYHTPEMVRSALTDDQYRLYDLIWRRFVACQMPPAEWDTTTVRIVAETPAGRAVFRAIGRVVRFDGFYRVLGLPAGEPVLPPLEEGQSIAPFEVVPRQKYTSPPPRYTEASVVKALEAEGIGRPSTYATIIDTIQERGYVEQEERKFFPTPLGELVTDKLIAHFPEIMDVKFTSYMEDELDKIEEAHLDWVHVLREFYDPFRQALKRAGDEMGAVHGGPSEYSCPQCGAAMVYRWSKRGQYLSCTNYPRCKATVNVDRLGRPLSAQSGGRTCKQCGRPMTLRRSRTGYFLGCTGYPDCRYTLPCDKFGCPLKVVAEEELARPCESCGQGTMRVRWKGRRSFLGCDRYPECRNSAALPEGIHVPRKPAPPPEQAGVLCDKCGRPMVIRLSSRGRFVACSGYPRCRNAKPLEKLAELKAAAASAGGATNALPSATPAPDGPDPEATPRRPAPRAALSSQSGSRAAPGEPPKGFALTRTGRPVIEVLPQEELHCPECGSVMELRRGRFGPFYSCSAFPRCRFVANLRGEAKKRAEEMLPAPVRPKPELTDIACEKCGRPMVVRTGRRGRFLGCSGYPRCKATREIPAGHELAEPSGVA